MNILKRKNGVDYRGHVLDGELDADIKIGSLAALATTVKTSVVAAVNSIVALIDSIEDELDDVWLYFANFYTKVNLQTSGQAAVHWDNVTNKPPVATLQPSKIGQVPLSLDGVSYTNVVPLANNDGYILTDNNGYIVGS